MKKLLIVWVITVLAFAGYKVYEYLERKEVLEQSRPSADKVTDKVTEKEPETHTVIPSSNKFFPKKKVYTNEDIKKLNEKKNKKGVITEKELKKYHKE